MSRVYEALKKAEKERKKKTVRLKVSSTDKSVYEEGIEGKDKKQRAALTKIFEKEVVEGRVDDLLFTLQAPYSQSADQFMKLCVHMGQHGQHDKRVVLITSALPQDGKTISASNLAIGLTRLPDTSVTLIDADLRKPELHKMLGVSVDKGLREYLEQRANISEIYYDTPIPRLFIIPGGKAHPQPEKIISSDKVQRLLEKLQAKNPAGYVVIDTSPVLISAELEILLNHVDSVIMVVRYGKTHRDYLQRTLGLFNKNENKITGIIFNQVKQGFLRNFSMSTPSDYYHS